MTRLVDKVNSKGADAADDIADSVHALMHLYRARQFRKIRDGQHELTAMEGRVLGFFARNPGATLSDLATHAARDKGQLARLIGALRERDLLEVRAQSTDRRVQRLHLTAAGVALQAAVQRQRLRVARFAVADLADEERSALAQLLRRVRAKLEATD